MHKFFSSKKVLPRPQFCFSSKYKPLPPPLPSVSEGLAVMGTGVGSTSLLTKPTGLWFLTHRLIWCFKFTAATGGACRGHLGRLIAWPPVQSPLGSSSPVSSSVLLSSWSYRQHFPTFSPGVIIFSPITSSPLNSTDSWTSLLLTPVGSHKPFLPCFLYLFNHIGIAIIHPENYGWGTQVSGLIFFTPVIHLSLRYISSASVSLESICFSLPSLPRQSRPALSLPRAIAVASQLITLPSVFFPSSSLSRLDF